MIRILLLFLLPPGAVAQELVFQTDTCGQAYVELQVHQLKHGEAELELNGNNGLCVPIAMADFCIAGKKEMRCRNHFSIGIWTQGQDYALIIPVKGGGWLRTPHLFTTSFYTIIPKMQSVFALYVAPIKGTDGDVARNEIIADLIGNQRFKVVESPEIADAVISGAAELGTPTIKSSRWATSSITSGLGRIDGNGSNSSLTTQSYKAKSLVLHATLRSGEVIWGWDNTGRCLWNSNVQCAVEHLSNSAGTYVQSPKKPEPQHF